MHTSFAPDPHQIRPLLLHGVQVFISVAFVPEDWLLNNITNIIISIRALMALAAF